LSEQPTTIFLHEQIPHVDVDREQRMLE